MWTIPSVSTLAHVPSLMYTIHAQINAGSIIGTGVRVAWITCFTKDTRETSWAQTLDRVAIRYAGTTVLAQAFIKLAVVYITTASVFQADVLGGGVVTVQIGWAWVAVAWVIRISCSDGNGECAHSTVARSISKCVGHLC